MTKAQFSDWLVTMSSKVKAINDSLKNADRRSMYWNGQQESLLLLAP